MCLCPRLENVSCLFYPGDHRVTCPFPPSSVDLSHPPQTLNAMGYFCLVQFRLVLYRNLPWPWCSVAQRGYVSALTTLCFFFFPDDSVLSGWESRVLLLESLLLVFHGVLFHPSPSVPLQQCYLSFLFPMSLPASLCRFAGCDFVRLGILGFCCFKCSSRLCNVSQYFSLPLVSKLPQLAFYLSIITKALPGN